MTKVLKLLSLHYSLILVITNNALLANSNGGFTLQLIHPHSPESPFFRSFNISSEERIKSYVSQSNIRFNNYLARTSPSIMRTKIDVQKFHYIVKIGIGTFKSQPPYKEYYLEMDTGSGLVWMQCEGCTKCFKQTPKPFPKQNSSSFRPILVNNVQKPYEYQYTDGASTYGIIADETFYFRSNNDRLEKVENLKFGCGLLNDMQYDINNRNNKIAGIMGLGTEDLSFVKQLIPRIKGRFSYCLPLLSTKTPHTYLRFGDDITYPKNSKSTPLYTRNETSTYFLDLKGISVNKNRLKINPKVFIDIKNNNKHGCIIDSGTPYSRIVAPAFDVLKLELEKYFSRFKDLKKIKGDLGLELCYQRMNNQEGFNNLPSVTFHFRGSQSGFVMKAEAVFEVVGRLRPLRFREYFCLAIVRSDTMSIIGAHQQTNHRMIHDVKNMRLVFYHEECSKNS